MILKIKRLYDNVELPKNAKKGDAGYDCKVTRIIKKSLFKIEYGFGISTEFEQDFVCKIYARSSIHKKIMILSNFVGIIDSGYRGELKAVFYKIPFISKPYKIGERAVQLVFEKIERPCIIECEILNQSERGSGGYGHSGK